MHNAQLMNPQTSLQVTKTRPYIWPVWAVWQWEMSIANMLPKMTVWSASLTCYQILIKNLKSWKKYCYCSRRLPETIISNGKFVIRKKFACSCLLFRRMWWVHYIVHIEFLWFGLWFTQRPHRYLTKEWMLFNMIFDHIYRATKVFAMLEPHWLQPYVFEHPKMHNKLLTQEAPRFSSRSLQLIWKMPSWR